MSTLEELLPTQVGSAADTVAHPTDLPNDHQRYHYFERKYTVERVAGWLLLIPALPAIGFCWLLVRIGSRGPGFFRQTRVGQGGQEFQVIKLRTMRLDAEANGPQWSVKGDPRITRLGRVLRALHLDELPQLFNVARGEMVLVGPRPERPEFVELLTREIPGYSRRLIVKPGITGLSQINLPTDSDLRSVERKQILDLHHIDHANAWMDFRMVLLTCLRVFFISSERLTKWVGLDRLYLLEDYPVTVTDRRSVTLQELLAELQAQKHWQVTAEGEQHDLRLDTAQSKLIRPR